MAALVSQAEMDFFCPVCQDIFKNPVVLSCSHSFCKDCLQSWWEVNPIQQCPVCKRRSSKSDPPCNLALKNLCEAFQQKLSLEEEAPAESEDLCSLHSEKLKLFCLDHQKPVCLVCRDSITHNNHRFKPIDEAAPDYRRRLKKYPMLLEEKLYLFNQVTLNWENTAREIKVQAHHTERLIKEQFEKLHYFLHEEEEARITALREEEEQKSRMMKQKMDDLNREIADISDTLGATEEELETGNVSFLQNYKAAVERVQQHLLQDDPQLGPGALIDVAKHLGNLTFNIWSKMEEMVTYFPVILDPNTAEPHLSLSEDLTTVINGVTEQTLPKNPERFEDYNAILGSEGFNLGTHSWDVEVTDNVDWAVGVIAESVPRKAVIQTGYWNIWFRDGKYRAYSPAVGDKVLSVKKPLQRIRVSLDCKRKKITFSDSDTKTNLHTFSHTFTEKLFPFIKTEDTAPLRISPVKVTALLEM
ncbi:nuclear factor 7, ovary-like [Micropterus salmoides]|uniref:nuclear factor 7, ovary-like n=1 Tax=Micropterus salmoides TaxID=27706 RepID=UPI0018EDB0D5|nr:nuclear factor 7, ovary-like [Micropterus salmoides]